MILSVNITLPVFSSIDVPTHAVLCMYLQPQRLRVPGVLGAVFLRNPAKSVAALPAGLGSKSAQKSATQKEMVTHGLRALWHAKVNS